ncbi:MAG: hypothetical protein ACLUE8_04695 [Lachnospiraceae bacterium]
MAWIATVIAEVRALTRAAGDAVRLMLQDGSLLTRLETVETER